MADFLGDFELGPGGEMQGIYTGDARELAKGIPDESVDLILQDPPFGIDFKYSNGYEDTPEDYIELLKWIIQESNRIIKPGGLIFIFVAQLRLRHIWPFLFPEDSRIFIAGKSWVQMRDIAVQYSYDPVIFWQKDGDRLRDYKGRDWHIAPPQHISKKDTLRYVDFHDCPRPYDTIAYMIDNFSPILGYVLDMFSGSGTTPLACKMTNRKCLAFEIDPATAELARQRVRKTQPPLPGLVVPEQMEMEL